MLIAFIYKNKNYLNTICIPTIYKDGARFLLKVCGENTGIQKYNGIPEEVYRKCSKKSIKEIL